MENFREISKNPRKIPNNPGKFPKFLESFQLFETLRTSQTKYTLQGCAYDNFYFFYTLSLRILINSFNEQQS